MLLFRSEEHVERWCRQWSLPRGEAFSPELCWRLAREWFAGDRRDPAWRRRTLDESQDVFERLGLTSPFWRLRP
jgi:hypothetical protein